VRGEHKVGASKGEAQSLATHSASDGDTLSKLPI